MPYIIDEEERDTGEGQVSTPGLAAGGGGASTPAAPKTSGSYVPLSKYLDANASKIPEFGAKVAGAVEAGGQSALQTQNQAAGEFGAKVSGGTPTFNEGLIKEAGTNPLGVVNDPNKLQAFREQQTATYEGPTSWTGSNEAGTAAQAQKEAVDYGKAFEDEAGRIEAVKAFQNPSAVTQGKAVLDAALLGMAPKGGLSAIQQQIAPVTSNLASYLDANTGRIATEEGNAITAGQTGADTIRGNVQDYFYNADTGLIPTQGTALQSRADTAYQQALQQNARLPVSFSSFTNRFAGPTPIGGLPGNPTALPDWAAATGLTQQEVNDMVTALRAYSTYGGANPSTSDGMITVSPSYYFGAPALDLSDYLSLPSQEDLRAQYTPETVATDAERANLGAIEQLLNGDVPYYTGTAGTPQNLNSINYSDLLNYIHMMDAQAEADAMAKYQADISRFS